MERSIAVFLVHINDQCQRFYKKLTFLILEYYFYRFKRKI